MIRLSIHFGSIYPVRQRCIEVQHRVYGSPHVVIDDSNAEEYIGRMLADLGLTFRPRRFDLSHIKGRVVVSDWLRYWFAWKYPRTLYMDTDCMPLQEIEWGTVPQDKPHLAHSRDEVFDYCYLYSGNAGAWFGNHLLDLIQRSKFDARPCDDLVDVLIRTMPQNGSDDVYPIAQKNYRHFAFDSENTETHWQTQYFW